MHYVYILKCKDHRFYIGCTNDLKDRVARHRKVLIDATKDRLPITIYAYIGIENKNKAFNLEKYLKSGSGRSFMNRHLI